MSDAFEQLGLSAGALRAIAARGYATPTAIQRAAIPAVLAGRDVWAEAQTGSGKTAAFALPMLQRCAQLPPGAALQALVLVPTRELAQQVATVCEDFARHATRGLKVVAAFGGVSINPQMMALRGGADVLVATPGRLLDLIDHHAVRLHDVHTLVLDEADRLFDLGFADELTRVLGHLPAQRQNLLFSATFPEAVHALAARLLHAPLRIDVPDSGDTTPRITQRAIAVDRARRTALLRHLIASEGWHRTLVFTATRYSTEHVADKLRRAGLNAAALHGELGQGARAQALEDFKRGRVNVLVATDLAARGIDIVELPAVVNYDLPRSTDDYLHRIGRTGRAGASGVAVSLVTADNAAHFALIEKRHALQLPREIIAGFEPTDSPPPATPGSGGIKGRRRSKKDKLREAAAHAGQDEADSARPFVWPKPPRPL
jgi:ATP-dependent RNA helicase RhlE